MLWTTSQDWWTATPKTSTHVDQEALAELAGWGEAALGHIFASILQLTRHFLLLIHASSLMYFQ